MQNVISLRFYLSVPPVCCHIFVVVGIAYLIDPDIYAGWRFYTPGRASNVRQVEG